MKMPRREWIARHLGPSKAQEFDIGAGPLQWLVDLLYDAGVCQWDNTFEGVIYRGLRWPDIVAWIEGSQQHDISPVIRRDVMRLSEMYATQRNDSRDVGCEAPFDPSKDDLER